MPSRRAVARRLRFTESRVASVVSNRLLINSGAAFDLDFNSRGQVARGAGLRRSLTSLTRRTRTASTAAATAATPAARAVLIVLAGCGFTGTARRNAPRFGAGNCVSTIFGGWGRAGCTAFSRLAASLGFAWRLPLAAPATVAATITTGDLFKIGGVFLLLHEVGHIEERVALQTEVHKSRLHARKHAGHAAFVNRTRKGVFVFPLVVDFGEQVVF